MFKIEFKGDLPLPKKENKINQGDYVYCQSTGGALSFWGIYNSSLKSVICLDGAGSDYIKGSDIYLGEQYSYWKIVKRIPNEKVHLIIEEIAM